jgi:1,4-dihydroxy-6-naphthoate synthase
VKLGIGISPCPNDVFVFSGWILGMTAAPAASFRYEDVETLNQLACTGEFDLVKISYANAPNCPDSRLLNCGGALGRGCGPLVLTGGAEWDPNREVRVPGEHTTANYLLDFWAQRPLRKKFVPFDVLYRELKSDPLAQGVVIHEMRFTHAKDGLRLVQDLGEHWEHETGNPIPLGALAYRADASLPAAAEIESAIRRSLDWAWAHEDEALDLCSQHAQDMTRAVMKAHVDLYVNAFTRDLGHEGRRAADFFLERLGSSWPL